MDIVFLFLCFIAITTALVVLFIIHYYSLQKKNLLPPQADGGWPVIGHLRLLSGPSPPHITLSTMADRFGPVFTIRLGVHWALVVNTWESAKECYTNNDMIFRNRPKTSAFRHMGYDFAMLVFTPYGPYWRELRKFTSVGLLSTNKVASLGHMFEAEIRALTRKLHVRGKAMSEMKRAFGDTSLNLMVIIVSGDTCADGGIAEKFREGTREFFRMMDHFVKWLDHFGGANEAFKRTGKKLDSVLQVWLEDRKRARASGDPEWKNGGFMGEMMVEAEKLAEETPEYDADTINKATCQTLILGGTDTMTVTLTWALSLLLNNPSTIQITQHELDSHVGRDRLVKVSDIKNLVYTQAIIKETLRLYPPAPLLPSRVSSEDCTVAGYHVPAGTHLIVNSWKLQRDPRVWEQPLEFRPERFVTGRHEEVGRQHFELLPFGGGRRICPGVSFAMQQMVLMIASLLQGFDIETGEAVDMRGSLGATNMKATPLEVLLRASSMVVCKMRVWKMILVLKVS